MADGCEELTASLVDRLGAVGVAIIALTDNAEEAARLRAIGVAADSPGVDSAALAGTDRRGRGAAQWRRTAGRAGCGATAPAVRWHGRGAALPRPCPEAATLPPEALPRTGRIIAVWGPAGSPGRTLVAANIAGELAAEGQSVLLVDADSYGASVAAVLGLLDESAGLAQACRLADQGLLDADALLRIATHRVPPRPGRSGCSPASPGRTAGPNSGPRP